MRAPLPSIFLEPEMCDVKGPNTDHSQQEFYHSKGDCADDETNSDHAESRYSNSHARPQRRDNSVWSQGRFLPRRLSRAGASRCVRLLTRCVRLRR